MTYEETMKAREQHRGFRYLKCRRCGTRWNVSKKSAANEFTYLCVHCASIGRRNGNA